MPADETNARALEALVWILQDDVRAERLLAVTGLSPAELRAGAGDPALLAAVLGFLEAHEADLIACARDIGVSPIALVNARRRLEA